MKSSHVTASPSLFRHPVTRNKVRTVRLSSAEYTVRAKLASLVKWQLDGIAPRRTSAIKCLSYYPTCPPARSLCLHIARPFCPTCLVKFSRPYHTFRLRPNDESFGRQSCKCRNGNFSFTTNCNISFPRDKLYLILSPPRPRFFFKHLIVELT